MAATKRRTGRKPSFTPTDDQRKLVGRLTAFGVSKQSICQWLVENGVPCGSEHTLDKRFKQDIASGRDRIMAQVGHKLIEIAMSDRPNNLTALMILARKYGGPGWQGLMEDSQAVAQHQHAHIHNTATDRPSEAPGVRLVILPANSRSVMTGEQIAAERERIARQHQLALNDDAVEDLRREVLEAVAEEIGHDVPGQEEVPDNTPEDTTEWQTLKVKVRQRS
jgi:hypothetical protein